MNRTSIFVPAGTTASLDCPTAAALIDDQVDVLIVQPAGNGVLIYGPAGSGKSMNSASLAKHYGKTTVLDEWDWRAAPVPGHAIAFTNDDMVPDGAISIEAALQAAGLG
jgi:hypothetical protein